MYFRDSESGWDKFGEGITRKIIGHDENLMMVKVQFERDAQVPFHQHPHVQCSVVFSGLFEVVIGTEHSILKAGDGFFVDPQIPHRARAIEAGIIIDSFYPARKDFLNKA
jgi:quercetin dioxygenase-like cupin family protein